MNNHEGKFIGTLTITHHDEHSKIIAIDQYGAIKRYSTSQIRPFLGQSSMLDESISARKIEDRHEKTDKDPDEPEYHSDDVQLDVDQQSF